MRRHLDGLFCGIAQQCFELGDQDVQRTAAETESFATFQQKPLRRKQTEGAKRDRTLGRSDSPTEHLALFIKMNLTERATGAQTCPFRSSSS